MLEHFLEASKDSRYGVVTLSADTVIINRLAAFLLSGVDQATLWEQVVLALRDRSVARLHFPGPEGRVVIAECRELTSDEGLLGGLLLVRAARMPKRKGTRSIARSTLRLPGLVGMSSSWRQLDRECGQLAGDGAVALITGERGSGKLAVALAMAELRGKEPVVADAGDIELVGAAEWSQRLMGQVDELTRDQLLVVRHIDRLPAETADSLFTVLDRRAHSFLATALRQEPGDSIAHGSGGCRLFPSHVHVPSLRHRVEDLGPLFHHLDERHGGGRLIVTDEAFQLMGRYMWPGNVRELERIVVALIAELSATATVSAPQLPEFLHRGAARRPLNRLELAEVDLILAALTEAGGNKDGAVRLIGMHRSTLYRKIQNYGLALSRDL